MIERRKTTEGKRLGKIAFYISESIVIILAIGIIIISIRVGSIDSSLIGSLLLFQGSIMTLVWGTKATANFAKREIIQPEESR